MILLLAMLAALVASAAPGARSAAPVLAAVPSTRRAGPGRRR